MQQSAVPGGEGAALYILANIFQSLNCYLHALCCITPPRFQTSAGHGFGVGVEGKQPEPHFAHRSVPKSPSRAHAAVCAALSLSSVGNTDWRGCRIFGEARLPRSAVTVPCADVT